jgi:hypothetical protein
MPKSAESGKIAWPIALAVVVLIFAASGVFIFSRLESWPSRTLTQGTDDIERLGRDLRSAFIDIAHLQPRITINNRTFASETTPTSELVVVSRELKVRREFSHTWAGSSKRIKLVGFFKVKAGFDIRQDVSVDIRPDEIAVTLPHAEILGLEQSRVDVLALENGLWNRISSTDVQNELAALSQQARQQALESGLTADAEQELQRQLDKRIHARQPVHLVFANQTNPGQSPSN